MNKLAMGLMSGTSCDGLSAALASFSENPRKVRCLAAHTYPYPPTLRKQLLGAIHLKTPEISKLNFELGHFSADVARHFLKKSKFNRRQLKVIGSHGHTVYHGPEDRPANTLQLGEPSVIAEKTGLPVVADFRPADIAAGGVGAPLVPFFDHYFFGNGEPCALQNIGGIGNVTFVGKSSGLVAFDTGPGNCLIDLAIQKISKGKLLFDRNGKIAARGAIDQKAIHAMIRHPYFKKSPPKSTGRELFNTSFIPKKLWSKKPEDLLATLTFFTAYSIYDSYHRFFPPHSVLSLTERVAEGWVREVIVSGGGAYNQTLMRFLKELLTPTPVVSIEKHGIPALAKEPVAFAFFALRAIEGKTNHLPKTTGARKECLLGKIIHGKRGRGMRAGFYANA